VRVRTAVSALLLTACPALVTGCGGRQSALAPESRAASEIARLWWWMLVIACLVFAGAVAMLGLAWVRRNRGGLPLVDGGPTLNLGLVVVFGIAIPVTVNVALFVVANFVVIRQTEAPAEASTPLTIEVTGRQWFWEVRYPGTRAVTANELHIPVKTPVNVRLESADVIHSFWVPELNKKVDMLPGHPNQLELDADRVGVYRGQCAEFCGLQHANMAMSVYVDPPGRFRAWLANMSRPLTPPASPDARAGQQVFQQSQCASCHTIRGTPANGRIGPDLTHLETRRTLAALTIPNTQGYLGAWIRDPQHFKPGNKMPGLNLSGRQFQQLVTFLQGLK
jgi:cytochrome c oxidase subunit II